MTELKDSAIGSWKVTTEHSIYLLDLTNRTGVRLPESPEASELRRDEGEFELLRISRCEVGSPMILWIELSVPEVFATTRQTTNVVLIERLSDER
ncbi:hypothetical protein [Protaetiibacter intestinalis]|uniref:Uncharacterized protein n=1 Tax=Protaetiibacter intestinalis TaxID=2419774 RepID=A0A387B7W9_9MICO|nr:hypothetical protein [Protaetiibacter intestinalis]AYF97196.1 hypothetical protein D7I47_02320 [Protaetiibacter intestinalis]